MTKKQKHDKSAGDRPLYNPSAWDNKVGANCYAYACNDPCGHYRPLAFGHGFRYAPVPGETQSLSLKKIALEDLSKLAVADGLIKADGDNPVEKKGFYLVALAVDENVDFHWYRKDFDGTWSHKLGSEKPSKTDSSGQPITNPKTANRGQYKQFGGYFYIPKGGLEVGNKVAFERNYSNMKEQYDNGQLNDTMKKFFEDAHVRRHVEYIKQKEQTKLFLAEEEKTKKSLLSASPTIDLTLKKLTTSRSY